jgi:transposase
LFDLYRNGRPPKLTEEAKEIALNLIKDHPQSIKKVKEELYKKTGTNVSDWTLKRLAKANGLSWKRVRKSLKAKRNEGDFQQAKKEIDKLKKKSRMGTLS